MIDTGVVKDRNFLRSFSELLLKEENRKDIMARYPKSERQRLRTVWGFSGLVEQMIRSGEGFGQLAAGFLHGDAMSSHVAHADFEGIGIVMEREYRDAIRRDAANRAHAARIISDQLWFCASRLAAGYRFIGDNIDAVWDVMNDHSDLWSELSKAQQSWYHVEYGAKVR